MITGNMHVKRKYVRYQDKMLKLHMKTPTLSHTKQNQRLVHKYGYAAFNSYVSA
jgi:hypothetical protein